MPGFPSQIIFFALVIFILDPSSSNQHPGLGFNALIFAIMFIASSRQLILASVFEIFFA